MTSWVKEIFCTEKEIRLREAVGLNGYPWMETGRRKPRLGYFQRVWDFVGRRDVAEPRMRVEEGSASGDDQQKGNWTKLNRLE